MVATTIQNETNKDGKISRKTKGHDDAQAGVKGVDYFSINCPMHFHQVLSGVANAKVSLYQKATSKVI